MLGRTMLLALFVLVANTQVSHAKKHRHYKAQPTYNYANAFTFGGVSQGNTSSVDAPVSRKARRHARHRARTRHHNIVHDIVKGVGAVVKNIESRIVAHPDGCPHTAFCGCGVALKVFGKPIRDLWLAANWFKFPKAEPAAGMVAVRRHHVFLIEAVLRPGIVLAYDPNSGGHLTRIHARSLAGYQVVNPHSGKVANL